MLNIAQITDLHLTSDLKPIHDVDVASNFDNVLKVVRCDSSIDFIALTGDLCAREPNLETMQYVNEKLDETNIPYAVIPGNHDDGQMLAKTFNYEAHLKNAHLYFEKDLGEILCLFLDSSEGFIDSGQLNWLTGMDVIAQKGIIVFVHHPPQKAVTYMDEKHGLQNLAEVQSCLRQCKKLHGVFCGHYHVEKTVYLDKIPIYITPSTFFQIDPNAKEFKHGGFQYGYRKITWDGSALMSKVIYI